MHRVGMHRPHVVESRRRGIAAREFHRARVDVDRVDLCRGCELRHRQRDRAPAATDVEEGSMVRRRGSEIEEDGGCLVEAAVAEHRPVRQGGQRRAVCLPRHLARGRSDALQVSVVDVEVVGRVPVGHRG